MWYRLTFRPLAHTKAERVAWKKSASKHIGPGDTERATLLVVLDGQTKVKLMYAFCWAFTRLAYRNCPFGQYSLS